MTMSSMGDVDQLERLLLRFRRTSLLPPFPGSASLLLKAIDTGEASARELERIISSDPALAADVLAVSGTYRGRQQEGSLRYAIMSLGQLSIRSLAIALAVRAAAAKPIHGCSFNPRTHSRHSTAVAYYARYLFARRASRPDFSSAWSADEVFAGGLLHDLGPALLAYIEPELYERVYSFARRSSGTFSVTFQKLMGCSASLLSVAAAEAWNLPDSLVTMLRHYQTPWTLPEEFVALCCLSHADELARRTGMSDLPWQATSSTPAEVEMEVGLSPEELEVVEKWVKGQMALVKSDLPIPGS